MLILSFMRRLLIRWRGKESNLNVRHRDGPLFRYQTEDGQTQIDVRLENDTVWLTQKQIAELFGTKRPAITKHLKNIYDSEELDENSTCSILEHMGNEGKQAYATKYYNLDAILSVGYRVKSKRGTAFRIWARSGSRGDSTHCF